MTVDLSVLRDAIAEDMVLFHPLVGEVQIGRSFAEGLDERTATMELRAWWKTFPDICMDKFSAFPSDDGVAYHVRMGGHTRDDGRWLEMWECNFWTITTLARSFDSNVPPRQALQRDVCWRSASMEQTSPDLYRDAVQSTGQSKAAASRRR
jgi:hypothetical protein